MSSREILFSWRLEAYFLNVIGVQRPVVRVVRVSRNQNVLQPRLCADRDNDRRMVILCLVSPSKVYGTIIYD